MGTKKKVHIATIEIYKEKDSLRTSFSTKVKDGISKLTLMEILETITRHVYDMSDNWGKN